MSATPITFIILAATVLVSWRAFEQSALFEKLLHSPYRVKHNKQYYRLFSHMLVHADVMHLALNMFVFYSFGRVLESILRETWGAQQGGILFIALYVLGGVAATLPSMRKHGDNYGYNSVGASGGVSSLLMAYMILFPARTFHEAKRALQHRSRRPYLGRFIWNRFRCLGCSVIHPTIH